METQLTVRDELHSLANGRSDSVLGDAEIGSTVLASNCNELQFLPANLMRCKWIIHKNELF